MVRKWWRDDEEKEKGKKKDSRVRAFLVISHGWLMEY